jgi:hypothetical protein
MHCLGRKLRATCIINRHVWDPPSCTHTAITEESAGDVTPGSARSQSSHNDGKRLHSPRTTILRFGSARPAQCYLVARRLHSATFPDKTYILRGDEPVVLLNILRNSKIHHRVHNSPPLVHILSRINPVILSSHPIFLRPTLLLSSYISS